jgi:hypothetical protein
MSPSSSAFGVSAATESTTTIDRAGAHQRVGDLQRLLAGVGLRDQQVVEIDAQLAGIDGSSACSASTKAQTPPFFWASATVMQRQRGLARAFRAVDLDDPALGQAADAERDVEPERAGRGRLDLLDGVFARPAS